MTLETTLAELALRLGPRFSQAASALAHYGQSETHISGGLPDAVVFPETRDEVAMIARLCAENGVPMVGRGAGTSLEGHALALNGGVMIDFTRMNQILAVHPEDMLCVVQPGITREALNAGLRATGLFFPVDPGANATLGGMAATRASGTTTVRYGTMRDNVLGLEVVLADGRVIRTGSAAPKSSAGYDLTALFVGSEGTLGLMTELTLRLHGQPEAISAAVCGFASITDAVDCVIATIQSGIPMARIEFLDSTAVAACNAYAGTTLAAEPQLLIEFHGSPNAVQEQTERFAEIAEERGCKGFTWAQAAEDRTKLWRMRHNAYPAILALRPGATALVTDVCVPISQLAKAVEETRAEIELSPIMGPILGHVGDGNFHAILLLDKDNPQELAAAKRLSAQMIERALRLGGTITGEHGIGSGKLGYMVAEHGEAWGVMGQLKHALDPDNLMNPGKMVRQK
ncbi:FAD-binding oxidoreductase [Pseudorhodobacter wandonensis]|jgi:D-lactate dehydrogenase (cytochrome)|uniref:FAD-binding oxidoreductase n=1 Tax=Pseudorhodobacter wandonensis TaxID=1120568 RepID=UPI00067B71E2|nr:FAD-linked oxidase C-terminal domain-containing protein [Pseudorhodobacter wandonensis]